MNEFSNIPIFDPEKTKSKIFATGMGIREFSRYSGIRLSSLHAWLRGTRNPKIFNIQHLASCLKCKISDISTLPRNFTKQNNHIQSTVLDRLAEEMKAAAVRNAEMRWSRYIADIREITERHFRRFDEQERERVFAEISTHPDRPPAVAVEYMARRIIEQMVPAAAAETKEATE